MISDILVAPPYPYPSTSMAVGVANAGPAGINQGSTLEWPRQPGSRPRVRHFDADDLLSANAQCGDEICLRANVQCGPRYLLLRPWHRLLHDSNSANCSRRSPRCSICTILKRQDG